MPLRPANDAASASGGASKQDTIAVTFLGDDNALIAGVRAGNPVAMSAFYDRYVGDVRRILVHTLGPRPELPDLIQDVFVNVIQSVQGLREVGALRSWLFQVTVRTARKFLRSRSRRQWLRLWPNDDESDTHPITDITGPTAEAVRATLDILDRMRDEDRVLFTLRYVAGMELAEMALILEISLSTLKRRLSRAEQRFHAAAAATDALRSWAAGGEL
jgi:RNA polymerase sigma-70 factor (ECF subfamily)